MYKIVIAKRLWSHFPYSATSANWVSFQAPEILSRELHLSQPLPMKSGEKAEM